MAASAARGTGRGAAATTSPPHRHRPRGRLLPREPLAEERPPGDAGSLPTGASRTERPAVQLNIQSVATVRRRSDSRVLPKEPSQHVLRPQAQRSERQRRRGAGRGALRPQHVCRRRVRRHAARHPRGGHHVVPVPRMSRSRTSARTSGGRSSPFPTRSRTSPSSARSRLQVHAVLLAHALRPDRSEDQEPLPLRPPVRNALALAPRAQPHADPLGAQGRRQPARTRAHTFRVKAHSKTGRESKPMTFSWSILTKAQLEAAERSQPAARRAPVAPAPAARARGSAARAAPAVAVAAAARGGGGGGRARSRVRRAS